MVWNGTADASSIAGRHVNPAVTASGAVIPHGFRAKPTGPPPPGYVCKRCGTPGHYIQCCPTNNDPSYNLNRPRPEPLTSSTSAKITTAEKVNQLVLWITVDDSDLMMVFIA